MIIKILINFTKEDNMQPMYLEVLKMFVLVSILFVWVVRYSNIIEEFKIFGYPAWLRDLVGISKIVFAILLLNSNMMLVKFGAIGICALMIAAQITHLRCKSPIAKMLPSATLLVINIILYITA